MQAGAAKRCYDGPDIHSHDNHERVAHAQLSTQPRWHLGIERHKSVCYNAATGLRNQHTTQTRHQHTPLRACMVRVPTNQTDAPTRALDATQPTHRQRIRLALAG